MKLLRKYQQWRGWGFAPKRAAYLAIKYINL
jgi:hypothetical protein